MVAVEVALTYAARPGLDPIRDRRLVEHYALASIQLRRAHLMIESEGITEHLGAFISKTGPLVERLEADLEERERLRRAEAARSAPDPLARYRTGPREKDS